MGRYLKEARHHAEKIQYYCDHAGPRAYSQAEYHHNELCELMLKAERSKNDKNDVILIQALKESSVSLMKEMQKRKEDNNS
jgi:hypothetical protein